MPSRGRGRKRSALVHGHGETTESPARRSPYPNNTHSPPLRNTQFNTPPESSNASHMDEDFSDDEELPPDSRPYLIPDGNDVDPGFHPSKPGVKIIRAIWRAHFHKAWKCWQDIEDTVKDRWFLEWKRLVRYDAWNEGAMNKAFMKKGAKSMQDAFFRVRKIRVQPKWMGESVYKELMDWWETDEFTIRSDRAKANRNSDRGPANNTGGCISTSTHQMIMTEELGRAPTHIELFDKVHKKKNGSWVDSRAQLQKEKYEKALGTKAKVLGVPLEELDNDIRLEVWKETAGANKKGLVYGMSYHEQCSTSSTASSRKYQMHYKNPLEPVVEALQNEMRDIKGELKDNNVLMRKLLKRLTGEELAPSTNTQQSNENDGHDAGNLVSDEDIM